MAFVYRSQRSQSFVEDKPGPGQYNAEQINVAQNTNIEQNLYHLPKISRRPYPGPGSYDFDSDYNRRIIYESPEKDIQLLSTEQPSSAFKSESKRFEYQINKVPGPGSYETSRREVQTEKKSQYKPKLIEMLMFVGQYKAINSIPYQSKKCHKIILERIENNIGPGQYEIQSNFAYQKQPNQQIWSKQSSKQSILPTQSNIGPGTYDIEQPKRFKTQRQSVSVQKPKYYVKRGMNNKIYYSFEFSESDDEYEYIDDATPGPGYYETEQSTRRSSIRYPNSQKISLAKAPRFRAQNIANNTGPGPGQYNPINLIKAQNVEFSKGQRFEEKKTNNEKPGPAHYSPKNSLKDKIVEQLYKASTGNFGVKEARFPKINDKIPGPGAYLQQDQLVEEQPTNQFKSQTNRELYQIDISTPAPGKYNLDIDSISYKLKKQLEEEAELLIKKPPFGKGQQRWQLGNIIPEEDDDEYTEKQANTRFKIKAKQSPGFQSSENRFVERNNESPSPWDYDTDVKWNKKSFNYLFANQNQK